MFYSFLLASYIYRVGSMLVYVYQGKANDEVEATLDYVVGKSDDVVTRLQNNVFASLPNITYFVPQSESMNFMSLSSTLVDGARSLEKRTYEVR